MSAPAEELLDDICCDDRDRVAAALPAAQGRGEELLPGIVARLERVLADPVTAGQDHAPVVGFPLYLAAEVKILGASPRGM